METTPTPRRLSLLVTGLLLLTISLKPTILSAQCDTEVSGVFTYCNAVGLPAGYFVAFRVKDLTGTTLNVVDLTGQVPTNRGRRINNINTQVEPATTIAPLVITGVGADTLEFWYFGPFASGTSFDIALVDPTNVCDTIFIASGTYSCADNTGSSDPAACDADVPLYFLDFSQTAFQYGGGGGGNENFDEIFLIMQRSRESECCDLAPSNQRCFEFVVQLGDQDIGLSIDDIGSGATAGEFYADTLNMFACTGNTATTWPFTQSGGQSSDLPLCLTSGAGNRFVVLSCKSGNNVTGVSVDAISNINAPPASTIEPCNVFIEVFGADSVMWSSPDDPNLDNLQSCNGDSTICTFFYDIAIFGEVTSCAGDTFTYIVSAMPGDNECLAIDTILTDTTYVIVYPTFTVAIDTMCNGDSLDLTAITTSAAVGCMYNFIWSTGETTQTITVDLDGSEYFVTVTWADLPIESQGCVHAVDSILAIGGFVLDCSNIGDTLYTCISQLPDPDNSLIGISGCGSPAYLLYNQDVSNGGDGCIGDTLTITRYYIIDFDGDTVTTTTDRDSCIQLLSFVDNVPPSITCPATVTVQCAQEVPIPSTTAVIASDNCGGVPSLTFVSDVTSNMSCTNRLTLTRTYRATDACGNSSTCAQTITVFDNMVPVLTCPAPVTVTCASDVPAPSTASVNVSDNCGGMATVIVLPDITTNMTCANRFVLTRTYRATDLCGNSATCTQTITVIDNTPPVIFCPPDATFECASQIPAINTMSATSSDNCGGVVTVMHVSDAITNATCTNRFTLLRTYRAIDACGNSATCTQSITVFDETPPTITCPEHVTVTCANNVPPVNMWSATVSDNCGGMVVKEHISDVTVNQTCANRFTINRTYRATDLCGNSSTCIQTITVNDNVPPSITCPAPVTVTCDADVPPVATGSVTASDNCGGVTIVGFISDVTVNQTCTNRLTVIRTYQASDLCGNTATCAQTITVNDNVLPDITCPANVSVSCVTDVPPVNTAGIAASDNCGGVTIVGFISDVTVNQTCANRLTVIRTYQASDLCGNTAQCSHSIFVNDNTVPTIACPGDITVTCDFEVPLASPSDVTTSDNCSGTVDITSEDVTSDFTCVNRYQITRTYRATDVCGNSATCARIITVFDDVPPSITCPPDATFECANQVPAADVNSVTASDNCEGTPIITHVGDVTVSIVCANSFTMTRRYLATDECGNTATCIQTFFVNDNTPPSITCPPDITLMPGDDTSPENTGYPMVTDNCGGTPTLDNTDVTIAGTCLNDYTIVRTWLSTDECQNTASCSQIIEVAGACNLDLSLSKSLDPGQNPIAGGDNVNFTITITNEGLLAVGSITVTDYIPDGFSLNDLDWVAGVAGSTGQSASTVLSVGNGELPAGGLQPGQMVSVQITLQADLNIAPGVYINVAEITAVFDLEGNDVSNSDVDSNPDDNDQNDLPGEDDIDPVLICVESAPVITGPTFVCSGETATYEIVSFDDTHTYAWSLPDGGGTIIENNDSSIVVLWTAPPGGPYRVQVIETSGPDCSSTGTLDVFIQGGEAIACLDHVNISLGNDCGTIVVSSLILTGDQAGNNNYVVYVIDMNGDTIPNATLTWMHVGQTFKVSVVSGCSGQSCWGFITVEDKMPPQLQCACPIGNDTCNINCLQIDDIIAGDIPAEFFPVVADNCGGTTIEVVNIDLDYETCADGSILVTYLATDAAGNTATCVQQLNIIPLTLETLRFPADYFGDCNDDPSPENTGWPMVDGIELSDVPGFCNILSTYTDNEFATCGGGRKIIRSWRVFDWCVPEIREFVQFIILADQEGPVLSCPANLTLNTDVWFCYANPIIPKPLAVDSCSALGTFHLYSPEGFVVQVGNQFRVNELPIGTHILIWTVYDECYNSSTCSVEVTIVDNVPPTMACKQHLIVSLTNDRPDGVTFLPATSFDDGSHDNCSPVSLRARRMTSCIDFDWTTNGACADDIPNGMTNGYDAGTLHALCVPFSCCDIGSGPIMVEIEATDAAGNINYCMVEVSVQDKLSPVVICPPQITISCEFPLNVTEGVFIDAEGNANGSLDEDPLSALFGNVLAAGLFEESDREHIILNDPFNTDNIQPFDWGLDGFATDNCDVSLQVTVNYYQDCSGANLPGTPPEGAVGLITRRFVARDNSGNTGGSCTQRIWIVDFTPFYISDETCLNADPNDGVIWPCDVTLTSCPETLEGLGEPVINDDNCSIIGVAYEDHQYDIADGSCYKILREWKIIDWCQYNSETGFGIWTYTQIIKVTDTTGPTFLACPAAPVELCLDDPGITLPANNQVFLGENNPNASSCSVHVALSQTVREVCSESVFYDVKIYPFNGNEFIQIKPTTELVLDENKEGVLTFNTQESTMQSIHDEGLPYNTPECGDYHRVRWTVEDGCGNVSFCEYLFRLEDCKDPSPVCLNGLSTVVMGSNGEVTIWASDFDASSFDDCTPSEELLFSFSGTSYEPSFTYTCDNVPEFGQQIAEEIWVADAGSDANCNGQIEWSERNKDFCVTFIIITDNNGVCEETGLVLAGEIFTEHTDAVGNVNVNLSSPNATYPGVITSNDGKFTFDNLTSGYDYTIVPDRNDDARNGVSTLDLVKIQKHLLGRELFTSGYQYVAADANNSESVSAIDLLEIRKLILGLYDVFPNNESWRFIRNQGELAPGNPWPFAEIINIDDFNSNTQEDMTFTGVKIGDVNNSAKANATQILPRNGQRLLHMAGVSKGDMNPGALIEVKFILPEITSGFQWTLELNGLTFVDVRSTDIPIDMSNVGVLKNGIVTMSWNGEMVEGNQNQQQSIVLILQVNEAGELGDMIRLNSKVTSAEAYSQTGEILNVDLSFENDLTFTDFALYQNKPNPWSGQTLIGFDLPVAALATMTVYDVAGKVVKVVEGEYKAGYNTIMLTSRDIPTPGVLYYRLESGLYSATKKMVILH
ncbi:MAG: T9SS type A sorting domain-containing protein [Bacteroidota bacterium]|nr:T9SS type A sorting domain-containing protein [Bacteroidota bacterium]